MAAKSGGQGRGKRPAAAKGTKAAKSDRAAANGKGGAKTSTVFGFQPQGGWLAGRSTGNAAAGKRHGRVVVFGTRSKPEAAWSGWSELPAWVRERALKRRGEVVFAATEDGPLWLVLPLLKTSLGHGGRLDASDYGALRDLCGLFAGSQLDAGLETLQVEFIDTSAEETLGGLVGLEIGAYRYRQVRGVAAGRADVPRLPRLMLVGVNEALVAEAQPLASSVNLARHLVNVPASELNPKTFADTAKALFQGSTAMTVTVWDAARLVKEGMGMLSAVGRGAEHGPALVHLRYRPRRGKGKSARPIAFVGKGITFDSGGLDLKDAASMRLMKKDMGGGASVLGLAHWVHASGLETPCDFYLALAENAVDERSFRPGDVLLSRAGLSVEIDNTDAEGRLVLGDAMDVAIRQDETPALLIDLATLTGAMRIALGTRLAGMFATDDKIAEALLDVAQRRADPAWRMPLVAEYMNQLKSTTADMANSGPGRFGGAITAAMFLQRFVGTVPWVHFDMYAWTDAGIGGTTETGGNGQCIQLLSAYLKGLA